MAENLNFDYAGSKCYGDDLKNAEKYGRLYDWETAKKACPPGWHLPTKEEWSELCNFVGGSEKTGTLLKAKSGWNESGNGEDKYGFAALPGGNGISDGSFYDVGYYSHWWSASEYYWWSSEYDTSYAYSHLIGYNSRHVFLNDGRKSRLLSVRCVKDVRQ